ncbi:hypothetical protein LOTGIDRAFT_158412 [Lottia gigantea]|uniref:Beta-ketoacyl synthase-like N-terminal domain-containing protein n=1 Tax=Lottia gigantea TaxID=225164 RepID=V4AW60_LOTGI|nr:hypothetical protein LOTGIDRAFT_158412 [Lottia gigantea]ESO99325.1 hypothetical protein LOTGIDRAFT_158412 [Lottia gigantea]
MAFKVAIVGVGCRFPGADDIDQFWKVLKNGENHVIEVPKNRWNLDAFYHEDAGKPGKTNARKAGFVQGEINDDRIFFGENGSDAKLEITNLQLFIPVITPSIEVETRIFNSLTKDIEIDFLHRNTVGSMTLTGESTTWPITNTIKPARYVMVGFKNLPDSQTNNNNAYRVAMNQTQNPLIHKVQVRLNNDNYPNQPLTINPTTKNYNEFYRNHKNMCELFGNLP